MNKIATKYVNIPIMLTWFRVLIVPFFVGIYYLPDYVLNIEQKNLFATIIFLIAGITDYLDGYLARKFNQVSSFGAFLDPVADKALVASSLVLLVSLGRTYVFAAIIIIVREIAISALREWMAQVGAIKNVAVAYIGKLKTAMQIASIALLLLNLNSTMYLLGNVFMLLAVGLTIVSMCYYLDHAKKYLYTK